MKINKLLILAFTVLFMGCTTTQQQPVLRQNPVAMKHIKTLYLLNLTRTMEANMNACFITLNTCKLAQKDNCWAPHEKCVINTMKQYKYLKEQFLKRWKD